MAARNFLVRSPKEEESSAAVRGNAVPSEAFAFSIPGRSVPFLSPHCVFSSSNSDGRRHRPRRTGRSSRSHASRAQSNAPLRSTAPQTSKPANPSTNSSPFLMGNMASTLPKTTGAPMASGGGYGVGGRLMKPTGLASAAVAQPMGQKKDPFGTIDPFAAKPHSINVAKKSSSVNQDQSFGAFQGANLGGDAGFSGFQSTDAGGYYPGIEERYDSGTVVAVPTLVGCRVLPWAKANLNYTAQALIISAACIAGFFITADKVILRNARENTIGKMGKST
ncbi:hypothetical protein GUJ93_ZPchr0002g23639 [Zizania palustris]|uniref:Uncharacterized protein n=1 Tax=Zizania palustris TaxID=103762 RepID=A0A8J5RQA9_ZIZPA|nr:hypothetical protein GUJ93_ZPchr0002g23639 [Zizania palustris]